MFKAITKYQTGDGKLHDSEADVKKHVESAICDTFLRSIGPVCDRLHLPMSHRHNIVSMLYANRDSIRQALELETFGSEDDE